MVQMLPSRQQILDWIADNPDATAKRDIAKAFNIKGSARIELKRLLRELEAEGLLERRRRSYRDFERLPPVSVVEILPPDDSGDLFARPLEWQGAAPMPRILFLPRRTDPAVGAGERVLVRLAEVEGEAEDHQYEARLMRRIGTAPHRIVGIFRKETEGGRILPIDKGVDKTWRGRRGATPGAQDGEPGAAWQNGYAERIMRTIKEEEIDLADYHNFADAYAQIGHFIEQVYQHKRIHSALGYLTPAEFEAKWRAQQTTDVLMNSRCVLASSHTDPNQGELTARQQNPSAVSPDGDPSND